jgi:hypothetical protein
VSERNPGGDRGRWSPSVPPEWPEEDESPGSSIFGPETNNRYPEPHWPGETNGPGSSVFDRSTAPEHPQTPHYPDQHGYLPPPAYPPTAPQQPPPADPYADPYPGGYPDPTRPQPRLPDGRRPSGGYPGQAPARRAERPRHDGYGEPDRGRRGRGGGAGGGGGGGRGFPLGAGFLFGASGLACFLLALLVLPWFEVGDQDVKLADMREAFTLPTTDPDTLPGANADQSTTTAPSGGIPTPDQAQDAVESAVRNAAADAAASAIDTGKARYLELYTKTLWLVIAIAVSLAVLFSTILSPKSTALSLLLGFRRLSGLVTVLAGAVHGAALWVVFSGDGPTPAFGVWLGVGGLAAVLLGCILGPKRS